jgi:putative ABC transport system ATP-binding protein
VCEESKPVTEPFIQIRRLVKTYDTPAGPLNVLRGIDLDIHKGDFVALFGPSGSGKTTFLNMLTGIDLPTAGSVVVDGVDVAQTSQRKLTRWRGRNIGIVFQFFQLLPTLTVLENVMVPMDFCNVYEPKERRERAIALLERLDIADQAYKTPDMLSGGQQQRVAIARALANSPEVILADEPTGNLDTASGYGIMQLLSELHRSGKTVIVVTHDPRIHTFATHSVYLLDGRVVSEAEFQAAASFAFQTASEESETQK